MGMFGAIAVATSVLRYAPQYLECKAVVDEQAVDPETLF